MLLDTPDYTDEFVRACERLEATIRHHVETQRTRELNRVATDVFEKYGIVDEHEPVADPQLRDKIAGEVARRFALHALGLPYVEGLTGEVMVARLKAVRDKAG